MYDAVLSKPAVTVPSKIVPGKPFTNSVGMQLVYIPPGRFVIGSPADEIGRDELEIQHQVVLSRGFYLQTTEVTQAQWRVVMGENPSQHQKDDLPIPAPVYNSEYLGKGLGEDCPTIQLKEETWSFFKFRFVNLTRYQWFLFFNKIRFCVKNVLLYKSI
jgi:formylglycine-generating enzyme required for sulfatase activity